MKLRTIVIGGALGLSLLARGECLAMSGTELEAVEVRSLCQKHPSFCPKGEYGTTMHELRQLDPQIEQSLPAWLREEVEKEKARVQGESLRREEETRQAIEREKSARSLAVFRAENEARRTKSHCEFEAQQARWVVGYQKRGLSLVEALQKLRNLLADTSILMLAPSIYANHMTEDQAGQIAETACLITYHP